MEEKKSALFREKNLEAIDSPESLNDYLRVTSPGVWLILAAMLTMLIGGILWSVLGRIETKKTFVVTSDGNQAELLVPYGELEKVLSAESREVTVAGESLKLAPSETAPEMIIISEDSNPYIRLAGNLNIGDVLIRIPLEGEAPEGVQTGEMVTETLQPISLLLR